MKKHKKNSYINKKILSNKSAKIALAPVRSIFDKDKILKSDLLDSFFFEINSKPRAKGKQSLNYAEAKRVCKEVKIICFFNYTLVPIDFNPFERQFNRL